MGSYLRGFQFEFVVRIVGVHKKTNDGSLRHDLLQQLHSLSGCGGTEYSDTSDITARAVEACDHTLANHVAVGSEHDGDRLSCRLGYLWRRFTTSCSDYGDPPAYQIGGQFG